MNNQFIWRGAAVALVLVAACASVEAPRQQTAATGPALHAGVAPLPRDIETKTQTVLAALGRSDVEDVSFRTVQAGRARIAPAAGPAEAAHEAAFADGGEAKTANMTGRRDQSETPAILAQNSLANNGGWREEEEAFIHAYSGMRCPKELMMIMIDEDGGENQSRAALSNIQLYDDSGNDTSCHYVNRAEAVYLTLYASNWPDITLEDHFGASLKLIVDRFPVKSEAPVIVAETAAETPADSMIEGPTIAAAFLTEPMEEKTFKTALWLNKTGPWHVKARATFPAPAEGEGQFTVVELVSATMHAITLVEVDRRINQAQTVSYNR